YGVKQDRGPLHDLFTCDNQTANHFSHSRLVLTAVEATVEPKKFPHLLQLQRRLRISESPQNLVYLVLDVLGFIPRYDDVLHGHPVSFSRRLACRGIRQIPSWQHAPRATIRRSSRNSQQNDTLRLGVDCCVPL